jgi:flagellar protein FliO/FliZ
MDALFGSTMPLAARFFIAFLVVLALIGVTAWLVRRFGASRLGAATRGRQPRLAVIDAASVDGRRRLVLIRRDNTEHLLMIGGPTDVVIEPNIVRATGAREVAREVAREPGRVPISTEGTARLGPAAEPSWQPAASEPPAPAAPPRPHRAPATEEPWLPPEPGARARPADSLTGLAAELSAKFHSADLAPPPPPRTEPPAPPRTAAPPVTPEPPSAAPQSDQNLAEMAQQLEAALRRAPAPEGRPPVTDPLAVAPPAKSASPRPAPRDFKSKLEPKPEPKREFRFEHPTERRADSRPEPETKPEPKLETKPEPKLEPKFEVKPEARFKFDGKPEQPKPDATATPGKTIYDNLEEEMASLLGRPPDKS